MENLIRFKDYKFLKTGEELPNAIKNLLGPEKNLKASVGGTTAEMISAMANKKAADFIGQSGLKMVGCLELLKKQLIKVY